MSKIKNAISILSKFQRQPPPDNDINHKRDFILYIIGYEVMVILMEREIYVNGPLLSV